MASDNTQRARFASRLSALPTRAGVYIMIPMRNFIDKQGKYGRYIGATVSKLLNVDILIDAVGKIIDRLFV